MSTMDGDLKRRLLMIGLDAADREIIERWADEGKLPNIARLRTSGIWSSLSTTADTVHVSAWPSIFSGVTPDQHGLYHAYVMREGTQSPVRPHPEDCPAPFLWRLLDDHGKKCIVMDAFLTCPLRNFGGVQIVDWGSWTWFSGQKILPASLAKEIQQKFGSYPAENHSTVGMTPPPDPLGFKNRLLKGVAAKTKLAQWLMRTQEWDFFLIVFGECHAGGHYFWHYQDEEYIAYPQECEKSLRTALLDIYRALDRSIGEFVDQVGDDTTILVVSGDGMGPNYSGSHLLPEVLKRMKLMNAGSSSATSEAPKQKISLSSRLRNLVPKSARVLVSKYLLPRSLNERLSIHWKTADIDWPNTRAFTIENANEGYVRVNLKSREPEGIVEPGSEHQAICDDLYKVARAMVNPDTGIAASSDVHKATDIFSGPFTKNMPDVIINWDPKAKVTKRLNISGLGLIESPYAGYEVSPYYTGNHLGHAFIAAVGPGLNSIGDLAGASILDLAPTILRHFNIPAPEHMHGKVRNALLSTPFGGAA